MAAGSPAELISSFRIKHGEAASSGHRKNLLLHNASRVGVASAKDASGKRTYWAMLIAGDYEPKPDKRRRNAEPLVAVKRDVAPVERPKGCHIKLLSLCI